MISENEQKALDDLSNLLGKEIELWNTEDLEGYGSEYQLYRFRRDRDVCNEKQSQKVLANPHRWETYGYGAVIFKDHITDIVLHEELTTLPPSFKHFQNLRTLDLSRNKLAAFPIPFQNFPYLQSLDLAQNFLTTLPESLWELKNLESLGLGGNNLSAIPEDIGKCEKLRFLGLSRNRLRSLPLALANCVALETTRYSRK